MECKRILLAEDDPNDVELTLEALAEYNLANDVDVVQDGAEALDYLHRRAAYADRPEGHPVVVLLDIKMPRVNGLEVLRQVKSDPDLHVIPVVIMTSSREEQDLVQSYRLGVNAYVVKPLDFHAFTEAVKQLGLFWVAVNQPPPGAVADAGAQDRRDARRPGGSAKLGAGQGERVHRTGAGAGRVCSTCGGAGN